MIMPCLGAYYVSKILSDIGETKKQNQISVKLKKTKISNGCIVKVADPCCKK